MLFRSTAAEARRHGIPVRVAEAAAIDALTALACAVSKQDTIDT